MKKPQNILIVRTDRIGDVVLTLPLVSILKKKFHESKISFLSRNYTLPLIQNNPYINEAITLNEKNGQPEIFSNVKKLNGNFDTCVVAYPTFRIALIMFLAGIKIRIGTGYRWYSFLFNKKIYDHRKISEYHELEYNVRLLKALGIDEVVNPSIVQFNLQSTQESRHTVEEVLIANKVDLSKKIIILHPGSGGSSVDLPFDSMKNLIAKMAHELDVEILITGSGNEAELCQSLIVSEKTKNLAGVLELKEMIALIEKAEIMIANSTGPIHIAAALGKNVIGFYPKIVSCSDKRWGPYTNNKKIFSPTIDCKNCSRKQCEELNCMSSINIEEVFGTVKLFLAKQN
ncbi:MAG: glycosyltransferase family 9 protein [Ignavibacteria bacterium]|nr:glycosyltransferase family 9 protein [Ignavibacteria bacterium]